MFQGLVQQDISPLVREAYDEAVRSSGAGFHQARKIPVQAAQNLKEKFSFLLEGLISNLEATEQEMDGALQQVMFVLRTKGEEKKKEEEDGRLSYSEPAEDRFALLLTYVPSVTNYLLFLATQPGVTVQLVLL